MVPKGWALLTVGDIFDVQLGKMLNKEAKKKQPQLRYLGNSNVRWGEFELTELNSMYFSEREINKYKLEFNDILVCEGGEVGRCAIWEQHNSQILYQKALHRLRVKGEVVPKYFQNYMQSIAGTKLLEDYTSRTSIAHLTREKLLSLPIKLPPLSEQQKIAKILSTWDKAISTTERLIDNSTQQKKALMQQLLTGKHRLLGESGQRFEGEWEEGLLGDLVDVTTGYAFKSNEFVEHKNDSYSIVRMSDLKEGVLNLTQSARVPKSTVVGLERYKLSEGDFIFGMSGSLDNYATVKNVDLPCYLNQRVGKIRAKSNSNQDFVSYIYLSDRVRESILNKAAGAAQLNISIGDLRKTSIRYPNKKEQQKIATVLINADKEIDLLEQQLADLQQEKKALMQVLLTGKKRVVVDGES